MFNFVRRVCMAAACAAVFAMPLAANAYTDSDYITNQKIQPTFTNQETCADRSSCLGMCDCVLQVKFGLGILDNTTYKSYFYNAKTDTEIMNTIFYDDLAKEVQGTSNSSYDPWAKLYFHFTGDGKDANGSIQKGSCGFTITGSNKTTVGYLNSITPNKVCSFHPAFCCCKPGPDGKPADCYRGVERNINTADFAAVCDKDYSAVGNGNTPVPPDGCGYFINKKLPGTPTTPAEAEQDLTNSINSLRQDAKTNLSKAQFYYNGSANGTDAARKFIGQATSFLFAAIGSISFLMYCYAGVLWLVSAGNAERVETSKKIFVWTTIGIVLTLSAYLIVSAVFAALV